MRIITGIFKGREIRLPKGSKARPTTGYVRELLMNLYTPDRIGAGCFLDICAGSGITGFEAMSRGARSLFCVEVDRRTIQNIKSHADELGLSKKFKLISVDARRCLPVIAKLLDDDQKISCCFADPPYIPGMAQKILERLASNEGIYNEDALIIIRTPDRLQASVDGLEFIERRKAGNAQLWIFKPLITRKTS